MNYSELRSFFLDLLNRDDCDDQKADLFISLGLRRVERLLRTPLQKYTHHYLGSDLQDGAFQVPSNYIGIVELRVDGMPVPRITASQAMSKDGYEFREGQFIFNFTVGPDSDISLEYYTEFDKTVSDMAYSTYSVVISDLVVYSALVFAADLFMDVRRDSFQNTLTGLVTEVQQMSDAEAFSGGGMSLTPYGGGIA
jgi:hypothetical protein